MKGHSFTKENPDDTVAFINRFLAAKPVTARDTHQRR